MEVSKQLFFEFRHMERRNRNLEQWNQWHREFNEVWDETLYRRALRVPKSLDERMIEKERNELFYKAVAQLPEIQRRRFLLYYEYDFNFTRLARWSIAPLPLSRSLFRLQRRKSRQK